MQNLDRLPCVHPVSVHLSGAPGLPVYVVYIGASVMGAVDAIVVCAREGEGTLLDGIVCSHSYALPC